MSEVWIFGQEEVQSRLFRKIGPRVVKRWGWGNNLEPWVGLDMGTWTNCIEHSLSLCLFVAHPPPPRFSRLYYFSFLNMFLPCLIFPWTNCNMIPKKICYYLFKFSFLFPKFLKILFKSFDSLFLNKIK